MNDNETVASVTDCIRHMADNMPNGVMLNIAQCNFIADRIEAAHRREIAELRECLKEAIKKQCKHKECKNNVCFFVEFGKEDECVVYKWRKALKGASNEKN